MTYKVEVKNTGKTSAQNVKITIPVDNGFVIKDIPVEEGITSSSENLFFQQEQVKKKMLA